MADDGWADFPETPTASGWKDLPEDRGEDLPEQAVIQTIFSNLAGSPAAPVREAPTLRTVDTVFGKMPSIEALQEQASKMSPEERDARFEGAVKNTLEAAIGVSTFGLGARTLKGMLAEAGGIGGLVGWDETDDDASLADKLYNTAVGAATGVGTVGLVGGAGKVLSRRTRIKARNKYVEGVARARAYRAPVEEGGLGLNPVESTRRAARDIGKDRLQTPAGVLSKREVQAVEKMQPALRAQIRKTGGAPKRLMGDAPWIRSIYETAERIRPGFGARLRRHEFNVNDGVRRNLMEEAGPKSLGMISAKTGRHEDSAMWKAWKAWARKDKEATKKLRHAMANRDEVAVDAQLAKAPSAVRTAVQQWRRLRGDYIVRMRQAGLADDEVKYLDGYYPNVWRDSEAMERNLAKRGVNPAAAAGMLEDLRKGALNEDQMARRVTTFLQSPEVNPGAVVGKTSQMQERVKKVVDFDEVDSLMDPFEAILKYVHDVETNLSKRQLFGIGDDIEGSLARLVADEAKGGWMTGKEALAMRDLLRTRFVNGERAMSPLAQTVRNAANVSMLANPRSAIKQVGDLAVSSGYHGVTNTLRAIFGRKTFDRFDLGVLDVAAEVANARASGKMVDWSLRKSGFKKIDGFGKNAAINASLRKMQGWARTSKGRERLRRKFGDALTEPELVQFVDELRQPLKRIEASGGSDALRYTLFSELSNTQPISLAEVPRKFADLRNGRLFYQMLTFTAKQMELTRTEFLHRWQTDPAEAMKFLLRYGAATAVLTGGTEMLSDMVTGKFRDPDWNPIASWAGGGFGNLMASVSGLNWYSAGKLLDGDSEGALVSLATPAALALPTASVDALITGKPEKLLRFIPFAGPFYRWATETN